MKTNLTEGDYQICELLRGLWMSMEAVAAKLNRRLPDVAWRLTKLNGRGMLDMANGFYRLSPARQLGVRGPDAKRNNGCWWATTCKTPAEKMQERKDRAKRNRAAAALRKHMLQLAAAERPKAEPAARAPHVPKVRGAAKERWFGVYPHVEIKEGARKHPKCYANQTEYKLYLIDLRDSGGAGNRGICTDCDRATMERMGARCEAPIKIKERMRV